MALTYTAPFTQGPQSRTLTGFTAIGVIGGGTTTNMSTIANAGPNGAIVTKVTAMPMGTVTASSLVLMETSSSGGGTTVFPVDSVAMPAYTQSTATALPVTEFSKITPETPKRLGPGMSLVVGCEVAQASGISYHCEWENF